MYLAGELVLGIERLKNREAWLVGIDRLDGLRAQSRNGGTKATGENEMRVTRGKKKTRPWISNKYLYSRDLRDQTLTSTQRARVAIVSLLHTVQ